MKVLVTGGRGYVGGRVCGALADAGHTVVAGARSERVDAADPWQTVAFDVADADATARALRAVRPDGVVHLAALNEIDSLRDQRRAFEVNALGTLNLLEAAVAAGASRVVYLSTFHVYGRAEGYISEDTATAPVHPYAATHHAAEDIVRTFARYQKVGACSLRLSNAYGAPRDPRVNRWTLAFNDFCRQAVLTGEIVLATVGGQHRDFITLHDVGRAVVHALASDILLAQGAAYNLGGRTSLSIRAVADLVAALAARETGAPVRVTAPAGDPTGAPVDYDISRLEGSGFALSGDMEREVLDTLAVCRRAAAEGLWPGLATR